MAPQPTVQERRILPGDHEDAHAQSRVVIDRARRRLARSVAGVTRATGRRLATRLPVGNMTAVDGAGGPTPAGRPVADDGRLTESVRSRPAPAGTVGRHAAQEVGSRR